MKRDDRLERLDDYVTGALAEAEAVALEEELFAAVGDDAGAEADLRFFDRTSRMLAAFAEVDLFAPGTEEKVQALLAEGLRVLRIDVDPEGGDVPVGPVADDVEVIVMRSRADIRGYEDVEVVVENADGTVVKTFRGVECDPATGNVYALCAAPLAKMALCTTRRVWRMTGSRDGRRELITAFETAPRR